MLVIRKLTWLVILLSLGSQAWAASSYYFDRYGHVHYRHRTHHHYRHYRSHNLTSGPVSKELKPFAGHSCERAATKNNELLCLACNAYLEAGVQSVQGQIQVDRTVMTRKSLGWGGSACQIVYQRHQYSWTWKTPRRDRHLPYGGVKLAEAITAAKKALELKGNGATNYYASYIRKPKWARHCQFSTSYGVHKFYTCDASTLFDPGPHTQIASEEPYDDPDVNSSQAPYTQTADLLDDTHAGT